MTGVRVSVLALFPTLAVAANPTVPTFESRVGEAWGIVRAASLRPECSAVFRERTGRRLERFLRPYEVIPYDIEDIPELQRHFPGVVEGSTAFTVCEIVDYIFVQRLPPVIRGPRVLARTLLHEITHKAHCPKLVSGRLSLEDAQKEAVEVSEVCVPW